MNTSIFREWAGVIASLVMVLSFIGVGYVMMSAQLFFGIKVDLPDIWFNGLVNLSALGVGFLIGKQSTTTRDLSEFPPPNREFNPCPPDDNEEENRDRNRKPTD